MIQSNRTHTTPNLSIGLLGGFHCSYREQVLITINTARLQSLLAYLVLQRDAPISRQHLAFLFWPDSSEAQARTNLRNLLHKLRVSLPDADRYIGLDQHTVQWQDSAPFILDVDQFVSLASQSTSIQDLKRAVQIYAGDFMPDCYDDWTQTIRESLRQTYLNTLEKLFLLLAESQSQQESLEYAHILLRQEPTREETYRHLMGLYAQRGDRASIARIYKTCVNVLERELGMEPSPATAIAYENFLAQATDWEFPLKTSKDSASDNLFHSLPASLTSFIGRVQELEQIKILLSKNRLVTLSGPGGIGKTRLALAAARELVSNYRDGIFMVDLAAVGDPGMVITTIADALQASEEVRAAGLDGLINLLRDQNLLLFLDNCEHIIERVGVISLALLQACPNLRIIATSRESLNVYGETVWQVPALPVPTPIENIDFEDLTPQTQVLRTNESVELFVERAESTLPTFQLDTKTLLAIAAICRHLEGMPLAIEMAAARVKTLTTHQIVQRLDKMLELLKSSSNTALPRHRTMEAVMDWSYGMLTAPERELFARLSVFSGHFSLQAAEKICAGKGIREEEILELLASLVDKSLVETLPTLPEARFRLHEIARQYARQRLEGVEYLRYWQHRHLEYFVQLVEQAEPRLRGTDQLEWLDRLDLEQENLRAALHMTLDGDNTVGSRYADQAVRLVSALWWFWYLRGHFSEGRRWAERALAALEQSVPDSPSLGRILCITALFLYFQGDLAEANALSEQSLSVCKAHRDAFGESFSYYRLGKIAAKQGQFTEADGHLHHGLHIAIQLEDLWLITIIRTALGKLAITSGNTEHGLQQYQQALEVARQSGDRFLIIIILNNLALLVIEQGDFQQAALLAEEYLSLSQQIGAKPSIAWALCLLGRIAIQEKRYSRAGELLRQSLQLVWSTRARETALEGLLYIIDYEARQDHFEIATRLLGACEVALTDFPAGHRLPNQSLFDQLVETLQACLKPGVFMAARTLGRLMSLEQAVSFALMNHSSDTTRQASS